MQLYYLCFLFCLTATVKHHKKEAFSHGSCGFHFFLEIYILKKYGVTADTAVQIQAEHLCVWANPAGYLTCVIAKFKKGKETWHSLKINFIFSIAHFDFIYQLKSQHLQIYNIQQSLTQFEV